ncbi:crosslink repair DNA glycosylase YcaQ family protein [Piscinibacter sp. XHJ-5]|uniref:DNA glycosylase AlkZ-like family protein n=1 Tax=Piscinibacter sp. XHJ-5 TaxID=3037797 RepID=UPI002452D18A|nr:crosslink repair DNA glycosylase YcaQ family protein [Piscinibacter sp. XHJ-5]
MPTLTLDDLRRYAVSRSLFTPTTLPRAITKLGFIQADPIRAPARAQDLTLRHRVRDYRAGDLEQRYPRLPIEEDYFVNYGFVTRNVQALMHPRTATAVWDSATKRLAAAVLDFIRERGEVHPREVDATFAHGRVTNYWGGSSSATTRLLDGMHYRGLLRVVRRESGIRIYAAHEHPPHEEDARTRLDALIDVVVAKYAPLPAGTLVTLVRFLRSGAPQWRNELGPALQRAKQRLAHHRIDGIDWYWPAHERPMSARHAPSDEARLLAPFDPIVWDRRRFELFWQWAYRFEAYTPAPRRKLGYYALPLLWRDAVIGWANVSVKDGALDAGMGYVAGRAPRERAFRAALDDELDRFAVFLNL